MLVEELLQAHGIRLADLSPGTRYTTCPRCSAQRSTADHRHAKILGVIIEPGGRVGWNCSHCGWTGPEKGALGGKPNGGKQELPVYEYRDASGVTRFRKVRLNRPGGDKLFWLEQPDGRGGWLKNTNGVDTKIIYRADAIAKEIAEGRVICVAEGEKDVDNLWRLGFPATCNAAGAAKPGQKPKWYAQHSAQLKGAEIVVFNDNDAAGYAHADATCRLSLGVAARVRRLDLRDHWPDIPPKSDVSDWLAAGHGREELAALIDSAPDYDGTKPPGEPRDNVVDLDNARTKRKPKPPPMPPPGGWPSWAARLRRDDRGRVIPDLANVMIALRGEDKLIMACGYDEMLQHSIVQREWPRAPDADPVQPPPHEVNDDDIGRLQEWLQRMGLPRIGRETVGQAIEIFARERRYHPVRVWLDGLVWDGVSRIDKWLFAYFGAAAEDDNAIEYVAAIGKMFLIAMVARVYQPGCQADYMLVLEGDQGILKSSACRALAGEWFSDSLPRIDGDQVRLAMHIRGKWLIEVAELAAMLKGDPEGVKYFVSRQVEKYTPKYGRGEVIEPRQCLFIGTTNDDDYIKDPTGGRRYWPVKCTAIDVEGLAAIREQLFAEAVVRFRRGEHWWPTAEDERRFFKPQQDERQFDDALAERVHEKIETCSEITLAALGALLGFDNTKFDMASQKRVAAILKRAKWRKGNTHGGGKIWRKPEAGDPW